MPKKKKAASAQDGSRLVISPPGRRVESQLTDKTVVLYANNAYIEASNWDIKIKFGQIQSTEVDRITVNEVAHVYMSFEHARAFRDAITRTLTQYDALKEQVRKGETKPS